MYQFKKKKGFLIPCSDCDCTFPTLTGFYLGKILKLEKQNCHCGEGLGHYLPIEKIDELYKLAHEMATKDGSNAGKSVLLALFNNDDGQKASDTPIDISLDIDSLIEASKLTTETVFISGECSSNVTINESGKMDFMNITTTDSFMPKPSLSPTQRSSTKRRKLAPEILVHGITVKTGIKVSGKPVVHTMQRIAQDARLDIRNQDVYRKLRVIYDDFMAKVDIYSMASYQTLMSTVKKSLMSDLFIAHH